MLVKLNQRFIKLDHNNETKAENAHTLRFIDY